jgi:hypothetical protein
MKRKGYPYPRVEDFKLQNKTRGVPVFCFAAII